MSFLTDFAGSNPVSSGWERAEFLVTPYLTNSCRSEHISRNALASGSDRHNWSQITETGR